MTTYSRYLKPFPNSQYPTPLGGTARVLVPGKIAVYDMAFLRVIFEFGNRCTAVVLEGASDPFLTPTASHSAEAAPASTAKPGHNVVVFNPMPYGPEAQHFLRTLISDIPEADDPSKHVNIKYLIAPDREHHMGLGSWKKVYPDAQILGCEELVEKKKADGIKIDYPFTNTLANVLISDTLLYNGSGSYVKQLPLPRDLTREFDFVYIPQHPNRELVALHKPTKTLLTGDLFLNLPATSQYAGCPSYSHFKPTSGFSWLMRFFSIDSWLLRTLSARSLKGAESGLQAIYDWKPETLVPAHGSIVTEDSTEKFGQLFETLVEKK